MARLNKYGVFTGCETIRLSDQANQKATVEVVEFEGRFFYGVHVRYGGCSEGSAGHCFAPMIDGPYAHYHSREAAILAAKKHISDHIRHEIKRGMLDPQRHKTPYKCACRILKDAAAMVQMEMF